MNYFRREDWTLFRNIQTIGQKAGVPAEKIPHLVARELVDNALDIAGACQFDLLGDNRFYVQDAGPGLQGTDAEVAALFSVARPLTSSKLLRLPTRGALGNGLRVVAGVVLASGGELVVKTRGRALQLVPRDEDGSTDVTRLGDWRGRGTRVEVRLGPALVVDDEVFDWAKRADDLSTTGKGYKGRTSPWWYDSDSFYELVQAAGKRTVRDLVQEFEGCSGRKAGNVAGGFPNRQSSSLSRRESETLLKSIRKASKQVTPQRLGFIGPDVPNPEECAHAMTKGTFQTKAARGKLNATIPFVIEVWATEARVSSVSVHVNRSEMWIYAAPNRRCWSSKCSAKTPRTG